MTHKQNIHATGLVYNGIGVLIRGESGAGKSLLTLALLDYANLRGINSVLVGDDRLDIALYDGVLSMFAPLPLQGKIELFGRGIISRAFTPTAPIDLLVDLVSSPSRMPEEKQFKSELLGKNVTRCPVAKREIIGLTHQTMIVVQAITDHLDLTS